MFQQCSKFLQPIRGAVFRSTTDNEPPKCDCTENWGGRCGGFFVDEDIAARNEELQATYWRGVELWRAGEGIGDALCHAGEHRQMLVAGYMAAQIDSGPRDVDGVGFIAQWAVDLLILEMALTDQYGHGGCVDIDQCFGPCAERAASPMDHPCWMRPSKCLCRE